MQASSLVVISLRTPCSSCIIIIPEHPSAALRLAHDCLSFNSHTTSPLHFSTRCIPPLQTSKSMLETAPLSLCLLAFSCIVRFPSPQLAEQSQLPGALCFVPMLSGQIHPDPTGLPLLALVDGCPCSRSRHAWDSTKNVSTLKAVSKLKLSRQQLRFCRSAVGYLLFTDLPHRLKRFIVQHFAHCHSCRPSRAQKIAETPQVLGWDSLHGD